MCQFVYKLAKVEAKDEELAETSFPGAWKNKLTLLLKNLPTLKSDRRHWLIRFPVLIAEVERSTK